MGAACLMQLNNDVNYLYTALNRTYAHTRRFSRFQGISAGKLLKRQALYH